MSDTFPTENFITENQKLAQTIQFSKRKGGRYTKAERQKRRAEVFRLHFELSYSAEKVAQMMNVNRHTIQDDIRYWYTQLAKEWNEPSFEGWLQKQVNRLEHQRQRLLGYLNSTDDMEKKLSIERQLFDVDNRLAQIASNAYTNNISNWQTVSKIVNDFAKKQGMKERWLSPFVLVNTTSDKFERINKILRGK